MSKDELEFFIIRSICSFVAGYLVTCVFCFRDKIADRFLPANLKTIVCKFATTLTNYAKLIDLLNKAENLAREFRGGYFGQLLSAERFHQTLFNSINKFKQGDRMQLDKLHIWFLPPSCWDDFNGKDGQNLVSEISELLSTLKET